MNFVSHGAVWYNCHMRNALEGRAWDADEVGERLKQAFAESLGRGGALYVPHLGPFVDASGRAAKPAAFIRTARLLLGRTDEAEVVLAWARSQVGIGPSFAETCRVRGWAQTTAERQRRAACADLADQLSRYALVPA
jgi:hypothetical protein